jgi:hypothetical protein
MFFLLLLLLLLLCDVLVPLIGNPMVQPMMFLLLVLLGILVVLNCDVPLVFAFT